MWWGLHKIVCMCACVCMNIYIYACMQMCIMILPRQSFSVISYPPYKVPV